MRPDLAGDGRARLAGLNGGADLVQQVALGGKPVQFEIPQDQLDLGLGRGAPDLVDMEEAVALVRGLGRHRRLRQRLDDLRRQM